MASPTSRPPSKPVQALTGTLLGVYASPTATTLGDPKAASLSLRNLKLFYLSSLLCNLKNKLKNKYKNHLKRDVHEIISYTSLFAANQYNTVNILLTLHPSMLRNLPHRYELSQLSVHCKQRSFHLRHAQCKVFSSQCQSLSLLKCFRR